MYEHEIGPPRLYARAGLEALPEFAPSAALWPRICAAHRRRLRARSWRRVACAGSAVAALIVATALLMPAETADRNGDLATWQVESRALEHQWRNLRPGPAGDPGARADVRLIDRALQSAYDRGADPSELAPLWQQRNAALRGLIANHHDAVAVTRI